MGNVVDAVQVAAPSLVVEIRARAAHDVERFLVAEAERWAEHGAPVEQIGRDMTGFPGVAGRRGKLCCDAVRVAEHQPFEEVPRHGLP